MHAKDFEGKLVRTRIELRTQGGAKFPAGTIMRARQMGRRRFMLALELEPKKHGLDRSITKIDVGDVELIGDEAKPLIIQLESYKPEDRKPKSSTPMETFPVLALVDRSCIGMGIHWHKAVWYENFGEWRLHGHNQSETVLRWAELPSIK